MRTIVEELSGRLVHVPPGMPVVLARRLAEDRKIRHLVVMATGDLMGVVCVCDLRERADHEPVADCMSQPVVTIPASATLEECARLMRDRRVGCLPVVSGTRVVGIVTRGDLSRRGFSDEQLGILRCASCKYPHSVEAPFGSPETGFCRFCRERSSLDEDDVFVDMGLGE